MRIVPLRIGVECGKMPEDETRVREARATVFLHHAGGRRAAGRAFAARGGREAPGA